MKVYYSRISSINQNEERQLKNLKGFDYIFTDKCSGLIPLYERPYGSQIKKLIDDGKLSHLEVHSIDRLGRNTLDVMGVWKELSEKGITVVCRNPSLRNFDSKGNADSFSELLLNLLASLSAYEKNLIKERQLEGIKIRKDKNLYRGRVINTKDTPEKFILKPRVKKILEYLNDGYTYQEIVKILDCSYGTIVKAKKLNEELGLKLA